MGGQHNGHPFCPESVHNLPHIFTQFDIHTSGRFIQKQNFRLVAEGFGDQHTPFHPAGQFFYRGVAFIPQRQLFQQPFNIGPVRRQAKQPAREGHRVDDFFKRFQRDFLRHKADQRAGLAVVGKNIIPADRDLARGQRGQPADHGNQRGLASPVRAQQRQNFAAADIQINPCQRHIARRIGFVQSGDRNYGVHRQAFQN